MAFANYTLTVYVKHFVIFEVRISKQAEKQLRKIPKGIVQLLIIWVRAVKDEGLEKVQKSPGYHDELLKGQRLGQRSIRLSRAYRAIYVVHQEEVEFVSVEEVSKHDY